MKKRPRILVGEVFSLAEVRSQNKTTHRKRPRVRQRKFLLCDWRPAPCSAPLLWKSHRGRAEGGHESGVEDEKFLFGPPLPGGNLRGKGAQSLGEKVTQSFVSMRDSTKKKRSRGGGVALRLDPGVERCKVKKIVDRKGASRLRRKGGKRHKKRERGVKKLGRKIQ